jgi:alpha-L-fucosidase
VQGAGSNDHYLRLVATNKRTTMLPRLWPGALNENTACAMLNRIDVVQVCDASALLSTGSTGDDSSNTAKYITNLLRSIIFFSLFTFYFSPSIAQQAKPTRQQIQWHEMEYYLFIHFGPNTFTNKEWGHGDEPEDIFNPTELDCRQWARIAKAAGAKGIIITAKHHDGFCLWPSKYSTHTVRESKWKNGQGDVLRDLSKACREFGLKFGVYISPWDRNHPKYGTDEYNDVYVNTMTEVVKSYGPVFEMWWDGANGEGPNGKKQVYDFRRYENTIRKIAPNAIVFSDIGPDIRWVGNENGIAGKTNWNYLDTAGFTRGAGGPSQKVLNTGNENGKQWMPAECDVSIRPGWFYHAEEDSKVKTGEQLFDLYLKSVGRGSNLLLNVPPDRRGLINENDSAALMNFKKLRDESFKDNLAKTAKAFWEFSIDNLPNKELIIRQFKSNGGEVYSTNVLQFTVEFDAMRKINCIGLYEYLQNGQTIRNFRIELFNGNKNVGAINGTTVGRKRLLTFPSTEVSSFKVYMDDKNGGDNIRAVTAYLLDEKLIEK